MRQLVRQRLRDMQEGMVQAGILFRFRPQPTWSGLQLTLRTGQASTLSKLQTLTWVVVNGPELALDLRHSLVPTTGAFIRCQASG